MYVSIMVSVSSEHVQACGRDLLSREEVGDVLKEASYDEGVNEKDLAFMSRLMGLGVGGGIFSLYLILSSIHSLDSVPAFRTPTRKSNPREAHILHSIHSEGRRAVVSTSPTSCPHRRVFDC